ncbi:MAG: MBL fold metallo-hydrolase [Paracoccaceae bacterium]
MGGAGVSRLEGGGIKIGGIEAICLVDGGQVFGEDVFPDLPEAEREARLAAAGLTGAETEFNAYVLRHAGGIDLVDTGCGTVFGDKGGRMAGLLAGLGIAPGDVTRILFTHLHGDHAGGAVAEGSAVFPQAEVVMHRDEAAFWQGKDTPGGAVLRAYARITLVEDGADLGHGIRAWFLPGHTPGHMGFRLGQGAVLVGDIVHSEALQLPDPALGPKYDSDGALAALSRRAALDEIADSGLIWSGSHMLGPGKFARLVRDGKGFARGPL